MRVQVITSDNGLGLSHDFRVLRHAITSQMDAEVVLVDWQRPQDSRPSDINIFLELLSARFFPHAKRNIYVPNPEWYFAQKWNGDLSRVTEVWAKTRDCKRLFTARHPKVVLTGWTSDDILNTEIPRVKRMLHVAGGSSAKGTWQILEVMARNPDLRLTMVARKPKWEVTDNVDVVLDPSDEDLRWLQNEHMVHLCPSSYEGFGHYINEARCVGATVITTNAVPMSDMFENSPALLVGYKVMTTQNLATHCIVDVDELERCMRAAMSTDRSTLERIGHAAMVSYALERDEFHQRLKAVIG